MHSRSRSQDHKDSFLHNPGTEHVGFSSTRCVCGGGAFISCIAVVFRPRTLTPLHCRHGVCRVITDQVGGGGW